MKTGALLLFCAFTVLGCGGYTTGTIQKSEKGFLKFVGATQNIEISIDEGARFAYNPKVDLYEIAPGRHIVKVYRDNSVVVHRDIMVNNQSTFEIEVP